LSSQCPSQPSESQTKDPAAVKHGRSGGKEMDLAFLIRPVVRKNLIGSRMSLKDQPSSTS